MPEEVALISEGLFWLNNKGEFLPVPLTMGHEEYAQKVLNSDLEELFRQGYVRIQAIPQYLLIDFRRKTNRNQVDALLQAFESKQFAQIIVSKRSDDYQRFDDMVSAVEYAETGRIRDPTKKAPSTEWIDRHGKGYSSS